jgi:putative ABC transport system permease protein
MDIKEQIIDSFNTLKLNKMRTGLAILGIVIGIASVIALVSIGQATQQSIQSRIQSLGSNLISVNSSSARQGLVRGGSGSRATLTEADAESITTSPQVTAVKNVSPEYQGRSQVVTGNKNTNTTIIGAVPAYATVHNLEISNGSFISDRDQKNITKVAVLGPTTSTDLFGEGVDPVGQKIRISGQYFTVIGITVSKGGSGPNNQDDRVYVPLSTSLKQLFGSKYLSSISVEAKDENSMNQAIDEIGYLLLANHKITDVTKADFSIMSQSELLDTATSVTGTFTALLSGVAAISLLVGGIGIMNIMLVTVTERTREIGLRKALGAKKKTIITQFLIESIILTFAGGILGIIFGALLAFLYSYFTSSAFVVTTSSVLLAFLVSSVIGIVFGWYPAKRASSLQPIEALRYE